MSPYAILENDPPGFDRLVNKAEGTFVILRRMGGEMIAYNLYDRHKGCHIPLLWNGGEGIPGAWPGRATILFPIVGGLLQGESRCGTTRIRQSMHGFAQKATFELAHTKIDTSEAALTYRLASNADTREGYPYEFILELTYALRGRNLMLTFTVHNTGPGPMFFQCGWHPGFALPPDGDGRAEWELRFLPGTGRLHQGLEGDESFLTGMVSELALGGPLDLDDRILQSTCFLELPRVEDRVCRLVHQSGGIELCFQDFPYVALWAQRGCDFICIEPCQGLDDHVDQEPFDQKTGIVRLEAGETMHRSATIRPLK